MATPQDLGAAIELFDRQEFYACHDALEALWVEAATGDKKFYQGILQIAVACHHLGNGNLHGAMVLLGEGRFRLRDYEPGYLPEDQELPGAVDVTALRAAAQELLATLQTDGLPNTAPRYPQIFFKP